MKQNNRNWWNTPIYTINFKKPITYVIIFGITTLSLYVALKIEKQSHFNKLSNIQKRLNEVCFKWNKDCNYELGNCTCEVKASSDNINYIMNK